jgi:Fe2+ or Zn2+ uptake regulation protein
MPPYAEMAIATLKEKGFRITRARRLVVEALDASPRALSAYELKDLLDAQGERVDTVSVYRILECLEQNHLIHRVLSTGKVKKCQLESEDHCHRDQQEHCHHLLICNRCETIQEVHCPGTHELVAALETQTHFTVQSHAMEFWGLCAQCG